ncbi:hypothetical protein BDN71DRAFT_1453086 [Pleurotus eryngii]|uniref:Uncharacterized protein n=1 Tax=Pleurotus eryngii TaxID=5323 RepID=A0A9P5ZPI7_PLEER|nr:hypothetical protein BDN71DRAFT_1453086 [Pleurotus eryngii]
MEDVFPTVAALEPGFCDGEREDLHESQGTCIRLICGGTINSTDLPHSGGRALHCVLMGKKNITDAPSTCRSHRATTSTQSTTRLSPCTTALPPATHQILQRPLYILIRLSALPLESPRPASDSGPCACDPCYNYTPLDSKIPTLAIAGHSETATGDTAAHRGTSTQVWDIL